MENDNVSKKLIGGNELTKVYTNVVNTDSGTVLKDRVHCFSMQVVMNKCFS